MPPQSSREKPSISTTRTSSPYFSPNSIVAPSFRASSIGVTNVRTGIASKTFSLTIRSTRSRSSGVSALRVREVEAQLVGPHRRPGLLHVVAEHLAQRGVQQVRRRVVRHRREALATSCTTASTRVPAVRSAMAAELDDEHLVVAELEHVDDLEPRLLAVDHEVARVAHLTAARGVERRLLELHELARAAAGAVSTTAVSTSVFA